MGTPVLYAPPMIENDKWYCCYLDCYGTGEGPNTCEDDFAGQIIRCKIGLDINTWLADGCECYYEDPDCYELCFFNGVSAQRLINLHGPYDNCDECPEDKCEFPDGCYLPDLPPKYYNASFSNIKKCSDDSLWVALNTDHVLECGYYTSNVVQWTKETADYLIFLCLNILNVSSLMIFERSGGGSTGSIFCTEHTKCTKSASGNSCITKDKCGDVGVNCGNVTMLHRVKGYGGSGSYSPV